MRPIQMVDLPPQYLRMKQEIDSAIENVLLSGAYIKGPDVATFENNLKNYTGAGFVTGCANGTDALQIALMALDLPMGAEVITTSFGYAALSEVILLLKLKPVFVEVYADTFLMDIDSLKAAITPQTRVIAPVHLYGQTCDMEAILEIAKAHNLYVIEDTAQAIGSQYTFSDGRKAGAGTMGHIGTTSFFPTKNLGCYGDGGAIFSNDPILAEKIKMVANHGQKVKYIHEVIGVNSRLDTLQAAILDVKLRHLDAFCAARQQVADFYDHAFSDLPQIKTPARAANSTHVFHQYTMTLETAEMREGLKKHLAANGIPSMIYYPVPLHQQQAYAQNISMPLTEDLCKRVLSLPIHTEMEAEQLEFIAQTVKQYFNA